MATRSLVTRLAAFCLLPLTLPSNAAAEAGGQPRTFLFDLHHLQLAKEAWQAGDPILTADTENLIKSAEDNLSVGPFSVTFHPQVAPSGDPHDIVSYGYYWHPNPDTPDGFPWIFRDGHGNVENEAEWRSFSQLRSAAWQLSLAYFLTEDERYAQEVGRSAENLVSGPGHAHESTG